MFGECGTSRNKNVHHYYKCANAKRTKTCKKKTVRKEWLEDLVVNETMKMIRDDDSIQSIVDAVMILQEQENTVLPLLEKQMKDIENGIENLLNAIQAGVLTSSTKGRLEKLEAQQKELEIRIAEEKLAKPKVSADFVKFWLTNFRKLDPNVKSHRETLINTFVNAVYLYDEKVLITFNYKDGTKTITFDEIAAKDAPEGNGSDLGCFAPPTKPTCFASRFYFFVPGRSRTMEIREILQSPDGYVAQNRNVPPEVKAKAQSLCWEYNQTPPDQPERRQDILSRLLGTCHPLTFIEPAFHCDYGFNIHTHGLAVINYNCVFLDTSPIHIGAGAFIAPGVCLSCAGHAIDAAQRSDGISTSKPIRLEDDVWIGANAVVCGGVTIGKGSVIGAGSVVTHDIPAGVVAAGVPCRPIRPVTEKDRIAPEQLAF